jgi:AcrR family transcriptional regulator
MEVCSRLSREERRARILDAALLEYGSSEVLEVSTDRIAARAGVSAPYVFRLFGTKWDLAIAAIDVHTSRMEDMIREAIDLRGTVAALDSINGAFVVLAAKSPEMIRCLLHIWAAASDVRIGDAARASFSRLFQQIRLLSGAPDSVVIEFFGRLTLVVVTTALDVPELLGPTGQMPAT